MDRRRVERSLVVGHGVEIVMERSVVGISLREIEGMIERNENLVRFHKLVWDFASSRILIIDIRYRSHTILVRGFLHIHRFRFKQMT